MTLSIELAGGIVLVVFCVIPVKEFRHIVTRLRHKPTTANPAAAHADNARRDDPLGEHPEGRGE